jgi:hypothetical protein
MEKMTVKAAHVLGVVVNALNESLDGFSYDPLAAEEGDYAADIVRYLTNSYLTQATVRSPEFWVV